VVNVSVSTFTSHLCFVHFTSVSSAEQTTDGYQKYVDNVYKVISSKIHINPQQIKNDVYLMYDRYDNHCRYFGIVSKLTKNPLNRRTGIAVTGPTNTATCTFCTHNNNKTNNLRYAIQY